jgi:hypothetical protein
MAAFLNACRFNPTAGGTTDWTYLSAVPGYQNPVAAAAVNGRLYKYRAESADLSQWELGEGAYNSGTGTFARTTVLFNSSGTTAKPHRAEQVHRYNRSHRRRHDGGADHLRRP